MATRLDEREALAAPRVISPRSDAAIDRVLRSLAPAGVVTGSRRIDDADLATLHPLEQLIVAGSVPKRQNEFATGRALLRELTGSAGPIGVTASRAPAWPSGVRGSLAHDRHHAVAAVTRDPRIGALGIDIEPAGLLADDLARLILRPEERGLDAHLAFALKEATYKAWSALGGPILDHHDVVLTVRHGRFRARVVDAGVAYGGVFATVCDSTVALVVVPAEDRR